MKLWRNWQARSISELVQWKSVYEYRRTLRESRHPVQVRVLQASQARESYLVVLSCFILCVWYMVRENSVPFLIGEMAELVDASMQID